MAPEIRLLIVGAGGFGREVLQYVRDGGARHLGVADAAGFLDDRPDAAAAISPLGVIGTIRDFTAREHDRVVIAIGDAGTRLRLAAALAARGVRFCSIVHPLAYVAATARLGAGSVIAPFAIVAPHSSVGEHVVINTYASVGHDTTVGDGAVLSPYAVINGAVALGSGVFMGTHACVTPGVRVGDRSRIAAGAVVYRPVPPGSLAAGNPAKAHPVCEPRHDRVV